MLKITAGKQMTNSHTYNDPTAAPTCYIPSNFLSVIKSIHYKQLPHTISSFLFRNTWGAAPEAAGAAPEAVAAAGRGRGGGIRFV